MTVARESVKSKKDNWLPVTPADARERGWEEADVVFFTGDAYLDHPSSGTALISRLMESLGLRVAIVPQPNWQDDLRDFKKFGRPKLFFAVTAGSMDSMVNHYTAGRRLRSDDAFTPGGRAGFRPDYATVVYTRILKSLYPDVPVLLGGVEASLRRMTHYDYWSDTLKPSVLVQSGADMLVYGMGEAPVTELVRLLQKGVPFRSLKTIPQTALLVDSAADVPVNKKWETIEMPSHSICVSDADSFIRINAMAEDAFREGSRKRLVQDTGEGALIINPPAPCLTTKQMDRIYALPFTRQPHPRYAKKKPIPAYEMIRNSVTIHRGCFGGCSFCSIALHQGKKIQSRSRQSIITELESIRDMDDFSGYITDLGGPSANMYMMGGIDESLCRLCKRQSCLYPSICDNLNFDHGPSLELYRSAVSVKGIKKVSIGSGIRYDMLLGHSPEKDRAFSCTLYLENLIRNHVSGRLKVAPEHTEAGVLKLMGKPSFSFFETLMKFFRRINEKYGLKQELVPYCISAHPGCTLDDMVSLALKTSKLGIRLSQVQEFTPTPMTRSTLMYYTGKDPVSGKKLYVARDQKERADQKRCFFYYLPENRSWFSRLKKNRER